MDGVKTALSKGEMESLSCHEKLKCVNAALQTKRNGDLMETLMEHLDLDRLGPGWAADGVSAMLFLQSDPDAFLSFHSNCARKALASRPNVATSSKLFKPGELIPQEMPARSGGELLDKMENDTETITLTSECTTNTRILVQHHLGMKEAVKRFDLKKRMVETEMANKKEGSKNVDPRGKDKTAAPSKEGNKRKKRIEDKKRETDKATDNVKNEKVRVKAELRSRISHLELEEEKEKQALASEVEKKNTSVVVLESDLKAVLEEKGNLQVEMKDVDAAIKSLMDRKKCIAEKQDEMEKRTNSIEELKSLADLLVKQQTEKLEKVQEDLNKVRKELDLIEGRRTIGGDLEKFLTRQIEELRGELECPVCMEVVTKAPIYKCDDDHLICRYWSSQDFKNIL